MREIVILSGKGGTGKTTLSACFAVLAGNAVLADCDVDAADLHLLLQPRPIRTGRFISGHLAVIDPVRCVGCGLCGAVCQNDAVVEVSQNSSYRYRIDPFGCDGCGACVPACPAQAIIFPDRDCGEWMVSDTAYGTMVHARLTPGGENSGRLVSLVKEMARDCALEQGSERLLIDGPPGIGCPVIASLGGVSWAVLITEPSRSAAHDLERILGLARHFRVSAAVCVNKWDLAPDICEGIEAAGRAVGARILPRVSYSSEIQDAIMEGVPPVTRPGQAADEIRQVWQAITELPAPGRRDAAEPAAPAFAKEIR